MFYRQISEHCNAWFHSRECTVRDLVAYMEQQGRLRDAQLEAIKTFLFLKLACGNAPLWELFSRGRFNSLSGLDAELEHCFSRDFLLNNPDARALLEYARLCDKSGRQLSEPLEREVLRYGGSIDYSEAFRRIFYNVDYADYLFSLPMGAGKTFLMAAFIYLDLYFALNEPANPLFAHNFMILAPSGTKSSILPSLRSIQAFDPTWILPHDVAAKVRGIIRFEILDEPGSAAGSNIVRNPNAQKVYQHLSQSGDELMGLVAITNAEKVILDRIDRQADSTLFAEDPEEYNRVVQANELRATIARIPSLAIMVDEVHHVASGANRLRGVINGWVRQGSFKYMVGFSGTPYLDSAEPVQIGETTVRNTDLSNVVYHYPITWAVGNFLKRPDIREATGTSEDIIRMGLTSFLDQFGTLTYPNGTTAKVAIYCASIEQLELHVYPQVVRLCAERGLDSGEVVLRFHGGNKDFHMPADAQLDFTLLDTPLSRKRIVLLVRIGQEGWDCKSLTAVILSQKNACPTNLVLQTSCRCLRQVTPHADERALIWLNEWNYQKLNAEFLKTQNTSISQLVVAPGRKPQVIRRYSRMEHQRLHDLHFMQMHIRHLEPTVEEGDAYVERRLAQPGIIVPRAETEVRERDLEAHILRTYVERRADDVPASLNQWLHRLEKESFCMTSIHDLRRHLPRLKHIFESITVERDGCRYFSRQVDQEAVRAAILTAFAPHRTFRTETVVVPHTARLLIVTDKDEEMLPPVATSHPEDFFPDQQTVEAILKEDNLRDAQSSSEEAERARLLAATIANIRSMNMPGSEELIAKLKQEHHTSMKVHATQDRTYHYLPYRFDSRLERRFLTDVALPMQEMDEMGLEVYYNGDDTLTSFKIECFREAQPGRWQSVGTYVPDFLICQRGADGTVLRILIVETKGEGYQRNFREKYDFMTGRFLAENHGNYEFLYLPEQHEPEFGARLRKKIHSFFTTPENN